MKPSDTLECRDCGVRRRPWLMWRWRGKTYCDPCHSRRINPRKLGDPT